MAIKNKPMKKLFSTISILAIITQLTSCTTSDATLTFEDEQTNAIRAHFEDYANANLEGMMTDGLINLQF